MRKQHAMSDSYDNNPDRGRRRGAVPLSELVGRLVAPMAATRSFAKSELTAAWPEIVGTRFAAFCQPEKLVWPKGPDSENRPALLVVRVHGPRAIYLQHEAGQIIERANAFLGYRAIGQLKVVQGAIEAKEPPPPREPPRVSVADENRLAAAVEGIGSDGLREALQRLGRGVLSEAGGHGAVTRKVTGQTGKTP